MRMKLCETLDTCQQLDDDIFLLVRSAGTDGGIGGELDSGGGGDIDILDNGLEVGLDKATGASSASKQTKKFETK